MSSTKAVSRSWIIGLAVASLPGACGGGSTAVRPDEMSAEAHRREAQKVARAAQAERQEANAARGMPSVVSAPSSDPMGSFNLPDPEQVRTQHLSRARELSEHGRQHEAAAAYLERFEAAECEAIPPAARAACPFLGPVVEIVDVPGGVEVRFAKGARVDAILAQMQCHFAYARARAFKEVASCPLYIRGIEIRAGATPLAIDVVSSDARVAREVRARSRQEAVLVHERTR